MIRIKEKLMKAFENVMGYDSLKRELMEIIDIMQNKEIYEALHASCPNGLLLYGEPGLGKTLIANSFIEASGRPAIICRKNASEQSFIESITESFNEALEKAPSIILLDDMDKFANNDETHKDSEAYVTIQSCIDTVKGRDVFVIATANNIRKLPDSLIRTGRFDRKIEVEEPNSEDSQKIIEHYLAGMGLDEDVDIRTLAVLFSGSSCSTLEAIVNQAGILAGYKRASHVSMDDLVKSYVQIGHRISKEDLIPPKGIDLHASDGSADVLWHEAGHLVMSELLIPGSVAIAIAVSRAGESHGFVSKRVDEVRMSVLARRKLDVMVSLGGPAANDIVFGRIDPGAETDIRMTLRLIGNIVDDLGGFAGLSMAARGCASDSLDERREVAASAIAELYYQEAKELLCENRDFLEAVVRRFAEKVILTADDIADIRKSLGIGKSRVTTDRIM